MCLTASACATQVACIDDDKPLKRLAFVRAQGSFWLTWVRSPAQHAQQQIYAVCVHVMAFCQPIKPCQQTTAQHLDCTMQ